jgi:hypothetical protein
MGAYASAVAIIIDHEFAVIWWIGDVTAALSWSRLTDVIAPPDTLTIGGMRLITKAIRHNAPPILNCVSLKAYRIPDVVFLGGSEAEAARDTLHQLPYWANNFLPTESIRLAQDRVGLLLAARYEYHDV